MQKPSDRALVLCKKLEQYFGISIILATAVVAVSLVNLGRQSVFFAPSMFIITVAHHGTMIWLSKRYRHKCAGQNDDYNAKAPPTARKPHLISCLVIMGMWALVVLIVIIVSLTRMKQAHVEEWERVIGYFEAPLECFQVGLLVFIIIKARRLRLETIHRPEMSEVGSQRGSV